MQIFALSFYISYKCYSGFTFIIYYTREGKKSTIELNFGENEMHEFQRKVTVFDTRGKILMSSVF